jgi:hypothetical protein
MKVSKRTEENVKAEFNGKADALIYSSSMAVLSTSF